MLWGDKMIKKIKFDLDLTNHLNTPGILNKLRTSKKDEVSRGRIAKAVDCDRT